MNAVPPFISNSADDLHCVGAVFRMVALHLLGHQFTFEEMDKMLKAEPGRASWTFVAETELAKMGLHVLNIEPIDYHRLHEEGLSYLENTMGAETYAYTRDQSNVASLLAHIPDFLKHVVHETRRADITEIGDYLKEGSLVAAEVNSSILNGEDGFGLHFILLYDFDGGYFYAHDPGLPAVESRKISAAQFKSCFDFPGANGEICVFSK